MKEILFLNPENVSEEMQAAYSLREAVRAVVLDQDGNVALLHARKTNYYKLPGGGIDDDVDKISALKRECLEEIGCEIEILNEIGLVNEWRKFCELRQISCCYIAQVSDTKGTPSFTESELAEGFEIIWVSYDEALLKLKGSTATQIVSKDYMVPRDTAILESARKYLIS